MTKGVEGRSPIRWNMIDGYTYDNAEADGGNGVDARWRWTARRIVAGSRYPLDAIRQWRVDTTEPTTRSN